MSIRIALCIVGQLMRLEIESKLALLKTIPSLDAFVVLQKHEFRATQRSLRNDICSHIHLESDVVDRLHAAKVTWVEDVFDPSVLAARLNRMKYRTYKYHHLHILQYQNWRQCAIDVAAHEEMTGKIYDYVVRLRDSSIITDTSAFKTILDPHSCTTKSCFSWNGIHDKTMACPRRFMQPMMRDITEDLLYARSRYKLDNNTETTLLRIMKRNNITVRKMSTYPVVDTRVCRCNKTQILKRCIAPKDCVPSAS
jgi:hypothetical protein